MAGAHYKLRWCGLRRGANSGSRAVVVGQVCICDLACFLKALCASILLCVRDDLEGFEDELILS